MKSKSIKGDSPKEVQVALELAITPDFQPTLAIVFLSFTQNHKTICNILDNQGISVFGATTNGEFIDAEIGKESIAILLMDLDPVCFTIYSDQFVEAAYRETTRKIARTALDKYSNPSFIMAASHLETDAEQLLKGFEDIVGPKVTVYGGMAGDDFRFTEQFVFSNEFSSNRGIVAIAFDGDKIDVKGIATCGYKALGTTKTVTKSEGNHVYTIDGIPALDLTIKYSGIANATQDNKDLMMEISVNCPLQLQRETGAPVMRPGLKIDWKDRSFYCSGSVPQGSKVKFSLPPDFDAIEEVINHCGRLKENHIQKADAIIYFTCAGRLLAFGPLMAQELEGIQELWKVPMVGMFSNAELGRSEEGNLEMHNLSSCVVVIKQK